MIIVNQYITDARNVFLILFNVGIVGRIIKILIDGQTDIDQNTKKIIITHIKAQIIANTCVVLISIIAQYFQ